MLIVRTPEGTVEIEQPETVVIPGPDITKGELVDYYLRYAELLLPYLRRRPLRIERGEATPEQRWLTCLDRAEFLSFLNEGAVGFQHALSRTVDPDRPTQLVFDLVPIGSAADARAIEAAWDLRSVLGSIGLLSLPMSTGAGGLQVVVPLLAQETFETVWAFSHHVAACVLERRPSAFCLDRITAETLGLTHLDLSCNARDQTTVTPFSVRALPEAPIALPLRWEQVKGGCIPRSSLRQFLRLGQVEDPWSGWTYSRRPLQPALARLAALASTNLFRAFPLAG